VNKKPNRAHISQTQRYAMLGAAFGFTFPIIGSILEIIFSKLPLNISNMLVVQRTDPLLWVVDTAPIVLGLFAAYAGNKQDLVEKINQELRERENELKNNQVNLEQYANERTAELLEANRQNERRTAQFEAIAHIARSISSIQTISELLSQITQIISEQFDFYHVGIFLLDTRREYAVLVAANSEGGRKMLKRSHRLLVGETGIVGYVTKTGQPRVALNAGQDSVYFNNPDLPDTLSEMALPLRIGAEVFGALDVQSKLPNAISHEDMGVLTTLSDQVSVAIQNARSYEQTREALAQAEAASVQLNEQQWKQFLSHQNTQGFTFDGLQTIQFTPSADNERPHSLSIPLTLRGTKIGTIKLSASDPDRMWTEDEIDMVQAAAERTSLALESARLLKDAQKRAAKERIIGEISAKIGSSSNLESILQTAIQELGNTLPGMEISVQFKENQETE
jgi:GAF domain-containing protein